MSGIAWRELMRVGLVGLRLTPREFWALTPAELMFIAGRSGGGREVLTRSGLDALSARFPDTNSNGATDGGD